MRRNYLTAVLSLAMLTTPALAIDFKAEMTAIDGKAIPADPGKPEALTLQRVCEDALIASYPDEQTLPSDEKNRRFWLAIKIHGGEQNLSADEITMLKKVIGKGYGPLVVGRAFGMLDPNSIPPGMGPPPPAKK